MFAVSFRRRIQHKLMHVLHNVCVGCRNIILQRSNRTFQQWLKPNHAIHLLLRVFDQLITERSVASIKRGHQLFARIRDGATLIVLRRHCILRFRPQFFDRLLLHTAGWRVQHGVTIIRGSAVLRRPTTRQTVRTHATRLPVGERACTLAPSTQVQRRTDRRVRLH